MKNSLKIALWEFKKNVMNKTFLISIIITPVIFFFFAFFPNLLQRIESRKVFSLYIVDEIGMFNNLVNHYDHSGIELIEYRGDYSELKDEIRGQSRSGVMFLNDDTLENKTIDFFLGGEGRPDTGQFEKILITLLEIRLLNNYNFSEEEINFIRKDFTINKQSLVEDERDRFSRLVPLVFALLIVFAIYITGMMILQSSIQEKKDKMVELLLSTVRSDELLYGKMIGFFMVGFLQLGVWVGFGIPAIEMYFKINISQYVFNFQGLLSVLFWLGGYIVFGLIFSSIGATLDDIYSASNLQGIIFMIPILPVIFIPALVSDPNGIIARVGSFIPLTSPGVMLIRLGLSSNVPTFDIVLSFSIIIASIRLLSYAATKIFKTGMLLYGKNPNLKEILKWLRY